LKPFQDGTVDGKYEVFHEEYAMNRFWKVAALVALAAIPLILIGKKKVADKEFVPESGDSSDIFERELSAD